MNALIEGITKRLDRRGLITLGCEVASQHEPGRHWQLCFREAQLGRPSMDNATERPKFDPIYGAEFSASRTGNACERRVARASFVLSLGRRG